MIVIFLWWGGEWGELHKRNGLLCEEHRPPTRLSDSRNFAQSYEKELDAAEIVLGDGWPHGSLSQSSFSLGSQLTRTRPNMASLSLVLLGLSCPHCTLCT